MTSQSLTDKSTLTLDKNAGATGSNATSADSAPSSAATPRQKNVAEDLREAIKALDIERTELVKKTIENIKPGRPFDSSVVREISTPPKLAR